LHDCEVAVAEGLRVLVLVATRDIRITEGGWKSAALIRYSICNDTRARRPSATRTRSRYTHTLPLHSVND